MGEECGLERMNHTLCVVLVLISDQFDDVFQVMAEAFAYPPGGIDLLPHIGTCKGPHIARDGSTP